MVKETNEIALANRRMILHDGVAVMSLLAATGVLFVVTLFLFRSFSSHRQDLGEQWAKRGQEAMQGGQPEAAIVAMRTALSYAPDERPYEVLLAQALGQAGHVEESYNYFLGLWETVPGDGSTNLELARLAARKGDRPAAVNYYRAAIYGTWEGDGVVRRVATRLELARYLIAQHQTGAARVELLVAGGNAEGGADFDDMLGGLLEQADDNTDAWTYFQKALAARPGDVVALGASGRLAYGAGDFATAEKMLARLGSAASADDLAMRQNAARIQRLTPERGLPVSERVARIVADRAVAQQRFTACLTGAAVIPASLSNLQARWTSPAGVADAAVMKKDDALKDAAMQLVYDTERATAIRCGVPAGDDALLLLMAQHAESE